jgi:hypothetical protein
LCDPGPAGNAGAAGKANPVPSTTPGHSKTDSFLSEAQPRGIFLCGRERASLEYPDLRQGERSPGIFLDILRQILCLIADPHPHSV